MTMTKLRNHGKRSILLLLTVAAASVAVLVVGSGSIFGSSESGSADPWRLLPSAPIEIDAGLTSVWTGEEMLVSGLTAAPDGSLLGAVEVAAAYDPETNGWRRLGAPPKTESSCRRSAVWTGTEMLVWGCGPTAFNPQADRWRRLPAAPIGAPGLAVWTGRELIGWGGGCCGDATADGAAYDPAGNTWRRLAPSPLAGSQSPLGAWTGRELILFVSGLDPDGRPIEGAARAAAYRPATDAWRRIAPMPSPRNGARALWDGREVLVVGGIDARGRPATVGYAYNPATNRWRSLPPMQGGAVQAVSVWTGSQLLVFGGEAHPGRLLAYDPGDDRWSRLPSALLEDRLDPTAAWTGDELLVWGGVIGTPAGTSLPPRYPRDGAAFSSQRPSRGAQ